MELYTKHNNFKIVCICLGMYPNNDILALLAYLARKHEPVGV